MSRDGNLSEIFRDMKQHNKERKARNLSNATEYLKGDRWNCHTEFHYSTMLQGKRLDYWPSRNKWQWQGKVRTGDVEGFIRNREK